VVRRRPSGSPRATRAMIDVLHALGSSGDVVGSWDLTGQADALVLRMRSRELFGSEADAIETAERMAKGALPGGYDAVSTTTTGRSEGSAGARWRGIAEVVFQAAD
jgi:hypothetical protein